MTTIVLKDGTIFTIQEASYPERITISCEDITEIVKIREAFTPDNVSDFQIVRNGSPVEYTGMVLDSFDVREYKGKQLASFHLRKPTEAEEYVAAAKILLGKEEA